MFYDLNQLVSATKMYTLTSTSNTTTLPFTARAIFIGEDGLIEIETENGDIASFDVLQGQFLPIAAVKIRTLTSITPAKIVILG